MRPGVLDTHNVALLELAMEREDELEAGLRARVLAALGLELQWGDAPERVRELVDRAVEIARTTGDRTLIADVVRIRNGVSDMTDPEALDRILADSTEMIEIATGVDDRLVCDSMWGRAIARFLRGDIAHGDVDLDESERLAERLRIPSQIARAKQWRAARALLAGDLDRCEVLLADYEDYAARETPGVSTAGASIRYRLQYERGALGDLEELLEAMIEAQPGIPVWRMALCGVYLQSDRHDAAVPHVEALATDDFAMVPRNSIFLLTCSSAARIASQVGVADVAEAAYRYAAPFDDQFAWAGNILEYPIGVGVGAAAASLGWYDLAEQHFASSRSLCQRAGAATYLVATDVHWAEMLLQREGPGDRARAVQVATETLAESERLGLAYMRRRSEAILGS
jgi:hypothetical protein